MTSDFWSRQKQRQKILEHRRILQREHERESREYFILRREFVDAKNGASESLCNRSSFEVDICETAFKRLAISISRREKFVNLARNAIHIVESTNNDNESEQYLPQVPRSMAGAYDQVFHLILFAAMENKDEFSRLAKMMNQSFDDDSDASYCLFNIEKLLHSNAVDIDCRRQIKAEDVKAELGITLDAIQGYLRKLRNEFEWYEDRGKTVQTKTYNLNELESAMFDHQVFCKKKYDERAFRTLLFRDGVFKSN